MAYERFDEVFEGKAATFCKCPPPDPTPISRFNFAVVARNEGGQYQHPTPPPNTLRIGCKRVTGPVSVDRFAGGSPPCRGRMWPQSGGRCGHRVGDPDVDVRVRVGGRFLQQTYLLCVSASAGWADSPVPARWAAAWLDGTPRHVIPAPLPPLPRPVAAHHPRLQIPIYYSPPSPPSQRRLGRFTRARV